MLRSLSPLAVIACALLVSPSDAAPGAAKPSPPTLGGASYSAPPPLVTITGASLSGATVMIGGVAATLGPGSTATTLFATPGAPVFGTEKVVVTTGGGSAEVD